MVSCPGNHLKVSWRWVSMIGDPWLDRTSNAFTRQCSTLGLHNCDWSVVAESSVLSSCMWPSFMVDGFDKSPMLLLIIWFCNTPSNVLPWVFGSESNWFTGLTREAGTVFLLIIYLLFPPALSFSFFQKNAVFLEQFCPILIHVRCRTFYLLFQSRQMGSVPRSTVGLPGVDSGVEGSWYTQKIIEGSNYAQNKLEVSI